MNIENLSTLEIHKLSKKQFENALKDGELNSTALYLTPDINAGEKTPEGGEIFNDYENNMAGCKAYKILNCDLNTKTYTLENYQNDYATGDIFSIQINNNYDYIGKITRINANNITVSFGYINPTNNSFNAYDSSSDFSLFFNNQFENKYLWVPDKPKAGNVLLTTHSHAEGGSNAASGKYSHAQGKNTEAGYCSHSSGTDTLAQGNYSMTSGYQTHARGNSSTAFGAGTKAYGENSLAIGQNSQTGRGATLKGQDKGYNAFAGGKGSIALGKNSFAFGENAYANKDNQVAIGKFNTLNSSALFIVGNGSNANNRNDAFQVFDNGIARIGKAPVDNMDVANKGYVQEQISALGTVLNYKGSVDTQSDLTNISNPSPGDVYNVINTNMNYAYTANGWDQLGTTVDLSGHMPLTGGTITNEDDPYASIIVEPSSFVIDYGEPTSSSHNSFVKMGADFIIGDDYEDDGLKFSGYIKLSNEKCNEIPDDTFIITAIGVEGNNTAKASWRQWLEIPIAGDNVTITDNKINVDLTAIGITSVFDITNTSMAPNANAIKTFCDENYLSLNNELSVQTDTNDIIQFNITKDNTGFEIKRKNNGEDKDVGVAIETYPWEEKDYSNGTSITRNYISSGKLRLWGKRTGVEDIDTFVIDTYGVEGNGTAKISWRNWLGINEIKNYIIEENRKINQNENAYWYYRKWSNGRVEAWFTPINRFAIGGSSYKTLSYTIPEGIFAVAPQSIQATLITDGIGSGNNNIGSLGVEGNLSLIVLKGETTQTNIKIAICNYYNGSINGINAELYVVYSPVPTTSL